MSDMLRITGMVSGMDTDSAVKQLIQIEQLKVDKVEQEKTYMEWQKEDYREVANLLRGFQNEYFDLLNPSSNMRSTSTFNMLSASTTISGVSTSAISIATQSSSTVTDFTVGNITQLATNAKYTSGEVKDSIATGDLSDMSGVISALTTSGTLSFTLDGTTKVINLDQTSSDINALATDLSAKLQEAFTNVDINADVVGTTLEFNIYENDGVDLEAGHYLEVGIHNDGLLSALGLSSGDSNALETSESVADLFGTTGDSTFEINGTSFTFSSTSTIDEIIDEINKSDAGVKMSYSILTDQFIVESTTEGTDGTISLNDTTGTLLADFKLNNGSEVFEAGKGSVFEINGIATSRSTNTFEFYGVDITLNETVADTINVNVETDTEDVKDLIVKFVDKYNETITTINEMLSTRRNYDYNPLTAEQKEAMEESDIEAWEKEARKGTLSNDATLAKITRDLRTSLYEAVDGLSISLFDLGIQTSSNYKELGKLSIDEDKLDETLKARPNEVMDLFTKQSSVDYSDNDNRSTRNSENGIAYRIYDILQDNIRITSDSKGNKGYLIEKAGPETGIDVNSEMAKRIREMDDKIDDLLELLADKEEKYYNDFARMESVMSELQSQGDWLLSQLG